MLDRRLQPSLLVVGDGVTLLALLGVSVSRGSVPVGVGERFVYVADSALLHRSPVYGLVVGWCFVGLRLNQALQTPRARRMSEFGKCLFFDLAYPFARQAHQIANLSQVQRHTVLYPEIVSENTLLALVEAVESGSAGSTV